MHLNGYYKIDEWSLREEGFDPKRQEASESLFSLGNGHMGQRANFEEKYTGESLHGSYIGGIYYPDKTRVGWWKNGYPEYFAKVLNAPNWIGIQVKAKDEELDLHVCTNSAFRRELNMRQGYLERSFTAMFSSGKQLQVNSKRFLSMADDEIGCIRYSVKPLNFSGAIELIPLIKGDVKNRDANYDEKFWDILATGVTKDLAYVHARTRKSGFEACFAMKYELQLNGIVVDPAVLQLKNALSAGYSLKVHAAPGDELVIFKYVAVLDSLNYDHDQILRKTKQAVKKAFKKKFDVLFREHAAKW